mmetsp:Transcript_150795/g.263561  ORF Transcript_150795/g.263561 Transcript_150795/m.263561 type:complete len:227 (+) Transcript_150795:1332-2012(+)
MTTDSLSCSDWGSGDRGSGDGCGDGGSLGLVHDMLLSLNGHRDLDNPLDNLLHDLFHRNWNIHAPDMLYWHLDCLGYGDDVVLVLWDPAFHIAGDDMLHRSSNHPLHPWDRDLELLGDESRHSHWYLCNLVDCLVDDALNWDRTIDRHNLHNFIWHVNRDQSLPGDLDLDNIFHNFFDWLVDFFFHNALHSVWDVTVDNLFNWRGHLHNLYSGDLHFDGDGLLYNP